MLGFEAPTGGVSVAQVLRGCQLGEAGDLALQAQTRKITAVRLRLYVAAALLTAVPAGLLQPGIGRAAVAAARPGRVERAQLGRECCDLAVLARHVPLQLHRARLAANVNTQSQQQSRVCSVENAEVSKTKALSANHSPSICGHFTRCTRSARRPSAELGSEYLL